MLDTAGNIYDNVTVGAFTPIGNVGAGNDISILPLFDRVYISAHNRIRGIGNLLVWEPLLYPTVTLARNAGGTPPTTPVTAVTSATAGNIQAGIHLFAVACETSSGFITRYDISFPGGFPTYNAPGGKSVDLTVPFGDPGTVKRHILATKRIPSFDGNAANYEFFFVGEIGDNVTPNITIDFVDSALVDSADFLLDQLETIPAFVQMTTFQGSLVGVGENANPSIARVSKPGEPESFQETDGFVIVNPGEGGGLKNCREYRGVLYLFKSFKTYSTINNGNPPNAWPVSEVDSAYGTECFGIGQIIDDFSSVTNDALVIATRGGLFAFDGPYSSRALSFVIDDLWANQDFTTFDQTQVFIDPIAKIIYVNKPGENYEHLVHVKICDYSDGLSFDQVKWAVWGLLEEGQTIVSIGVVFGTNFIPRFFFIGTDGGGTSEVYRVDGDTCETIALLTPHPVNPDGQPSIKHSDGGYFISERTGAGTGFVTAPNGVNFQIPSLDSPGRNDLNTFRWKENSRRDYFILEFELNALAGSGAGSSVSLNKIVLNYLPNEDEIPG